MLFEQKCLVLRRIPSRSPSSIDELIILGRRKPIEVTGELIYREIRPHDFRRVYELAPSIDATKITANIEQGILTVTLPKAETVKPRKIAVQ